MSNLQGPVAEYLTNLNGRDVPAWMVSGIQRLAAALEQEISEDLAAIRETVAPCACGPDDACKTCVGAAA